jgi:hypothetical protein
MPQGFCRPCRDWLGSLPRSPDQPFSGSQDNLPAGARKGPNASVPAGGRGSCSSASLRLKGQLSIAGGRLSVEEAVPRLPSGL